MFLVIIQLLIIKIQQEKAGNNNECLDLTEGIFQNSDLGFVVYTTVRPEFFHFCQHSGFSRESVNSVFSLAVSVFAMCHR